MALRVTCQQSSKCISITATGFEPPLCLRIWDLFNVRVLSYLAVFEDVKIFGLQLGKHFELFLGGSLLGLPTPTQKLLYASLQAEIKINK